MAGAAGELHGVSFISSVNHEGPPTCLITSQRPHLPRLSHWVLESHMNFGETTLQPVIYQALHGIQRHWRDWAPRRWSTGHPGRLLVDRLPWEDPSATVPANQLQERRQRAQLCAVPDLAWVRVPAVSKAGGAVPMSACPWSVCVTWSPTGSAFAQPLYQSSHGQKRP